MKLIVRTFCLMVLFALMIWLLTYLNNINFLSNEIHNAAYMAIEETMDKEMKYLSSNDNDEFNIENTFIESFNGLVSDSKNYNLKLKSDQEHGILKVNIKCNYSNLVKDVILTNIIEDKLEEIDAGGFDEFDVKNFEYATRTDNVLYEKEFDEPVMLKSFYIDIEAYSKSNGDSLLNRYEPEMVITIINDEDDVIVYTKPGVNGKKTGNEVNFDSDDYDFEEIMVKSVTLEMKAISNSIAPKAERLRIGSTGKNYFEYDGQKKTKHNLTSKYIDASTFKPDNDSIWSHQEYKEILEEYK